MTFGSYTVMKNPRVWEDAAKSLMPRIKKMCKEQKMIPVGEPRIIKMRHWVYNQFGQKERVFAVGLLQDAKQDKNRI